MTQKDNVKQLIGKSLNAYNNKVLQQIGRIEKKNKQQNHKISMLTNELDNDYLTKTEEGSVISLEHSKEGMVYIDSLEGNTLVNYCTDGAKELTLNGDIDLEGTFVTTTEGVDNGLVDVYCEGNTLVNIIDGRWYNGTTETKNNRECFKITKDSSANHLSITNIKSGVPYTLIYDYTSTELIRGTTNPFGRLHLTLSNESGWVYDVPVKDFESNKSSFVTSISVFTIPTHIQFSSLMITGTLRDIEGTVWLDKNILLLEGDWTNKEIPPYFEGMKSVGQDDENGHKIEILSQNKNLCTVSSYSGVCHNKIESNIPCKKNTVYTLTFKDESDLNQSGNRGITLITHKTKTDKNDHGNIYTYAMNEGGKEYTFRKSGFTFNTSDCCYISLTSNNMSSVPNLIIKEIQIEEGSQTSYSPQMFNKKEILLNEPLRGINDTIKDRFVKIGNKCFIERNCKVQTLNGSEGWRISDGGTQFICNQHRTDALGATNIPIICDKINVTTHQILDNGEGYGINLSYYLRINLRDCDAKNGATVEQFIQRLQANPVTIIYPLKTPTYDPLEIEPTLNTYTDTTHISNNSIIPCNMKIQNTGYNAIIKPSTLYTVALDTNKSGTIGMNLGGVKGTTTNNVLTLTTPATLTDDSLRLYGKGIKGSKVRLLEGDKTNWIPSHFEGMKSSFEDKLQDDGTYKMEILCNNKNLFDNSKNRLAQRGSVVLTYDENSKTYTVNNTGNSDGIHQGDWGASTFYDISGKPESRENLLFLKCKKGDKISIKAKGTFSQIHIMERNNYNSTTKSFTYNQQEVVHTISHECTTRLEIIFMHPILGTTFTVKDIQIGYLDKVFENYIENRHNKIQFSSIEPMRGINDSIRDKFVFKDNKLMIERNVTERIINGTEVINPNVINDKVVRITITHKGNQYKDNKLIKCDGFPSNGDTQSMETAFVATDLLVLSIYKHRLKEKTTQGFINWLKENPQKVQFKSVEPTYEEIPFELQKIILEGYENGTLFFDTNIPPTSTITYAGETPIVKSVILNKTEVSNNTNDINDNIIPYLMDMDYRVVCLQLESNVEGISMAKLFGGVYEMLKRDILSKRLSKEEYDYRLIDYFNAGKLTEEEVRELEDLK